MEKAAAEKFFRRRSDSEIVVKSFHSRFLFFNSPLKNPGDCPKPILMGLWTVTFSRFFVQK